MRVACTLVAVLALTAPAAAQAPANPLTAGMKATYEMVKGHITKSADKVPEEQYSYKPTPEVRSFGDVLAHIADANHMICGAAGGPEAPKEKVEKNKTSKADLQKALAASFAACDAAFAAMTDAKGAEVVKFFGREQPRLAILAMNTAHDFEHYGNLVTYMRIKGIVPPSSEPRQGSE